MFNVIKQCPKMNTTETIIQKTIDIVKKTIFETSKNDPNYFVETIKDGIAYICSSLAYAISQAILRYCAGEFYPLYGISIFINFIVSKFKSDSMIVTSIEDIEMYQLYMGFQ